ncbi:MAG: PAS domain S-box protein, partial [Phycisphaerales bacterium]|nr:PAS domain S-box protein [Phycisphaerales bacterium]
MSRDLELRLREMNEALLVGAVRQQELAEQARDAEEATRESEQRYRALFNSIDEGFCIIEVIFDGHEKPVDYRFLEVNPMFEKQSGLLNAVGKTMRELRPAHEESWFQIYGKVALTGEPIRFVNEAKELAGRWYDLYACRVGGPESRKVAVVFNDISEREKTQEALRESHARFETLFDTSPVGMYLVDEQFRLRKVSEKTRAVFGDIPDLIGRDFAEVVHILWTPSAAGEIIARFRHTLATGEPYKHAELSEVRFDSNVREYYDWELHRIALPDGQYGVVCYFLDISARVLAQQAVVESETRYRRLFETAKDGILILDARTGRITDTNAIMGGLVGREAHELLGKELHEIGLFGDTEASKRAFKELQENRYIRYEHLLVKNRHGRSVEVEVVASVYREDQTLVAQCNVRDISQRVVMENKIRQQAEDLAGESRRKDEFLAMLSHELRNPLAPIRAAVYLLKLHQRGAANTIQTQAHEAIERQVVNLTKIVNDLLEVSRVISGRVSLDLHAVDVNQVVRHSVETVMPLIEEHKHELVLNLSPHALWVNADATRLEEVLVNLLNNAAKYTPDGGTIAVDSERLAHGARSDQALVRVRDNGSGIGPDLLTTGGSGVARIFDLFTRADSSLARSAGGLGIGLSLAHRLITMHGGTIEAHSAGPGKGSELAVCLPLVAAPVAAAQHERPPGGEASDHSGIRVLVVDDNIDLVTMLCGTLRLKGYTVQSAHTGPEGLRIAQEWRPDIALLDIGLPDMDGYEIARRL